MKRIPRVAPSAGRNERVRRRQVTRQQDVQWIGAVHAADGLRHRFLGTEIRIAFQAMERSFATASGMAFAPAHGTLLVIVDEHPDLTQQQLSYALGLQRSTITRTIDVLERDELLRRYARPGDRRSYAIRITEKGARLAAQLRPVILELEDRMSRRLGVRRRAQLMRLLREAQEALLVE